MTNDNFACLKLKNTFLELTVGEPFGISRAISCPASISVSEEARDYITSPYLDAISESETEVSDSNHTHATPSTRLFTTVMLRNIPNKYSQSLLLDAVNLKGFSTLYDFFYLPVDFRNGCNMGYAFINFIWHDIASDFIAVFRGFRLPALRSTKVCDVSWARIQGLQANVDHYRNNPINNLADPFFRPLIFDAGKAVDFPRPDKLCHRVASRRIAATRPDQKPCSQVDKIFIGGISPETDSLDLRNYFEKFGVVLEAAIVRDKKSGLSRGFGFCCFNDSEAVSKVLAVRQHIVLGHSVGVRRYSIKP